MSEKNKSFEKDFVTYDIACGLKEIGYTEECLAYWFKAVHYAKKEELVVINPEIALDWNVVDEAISSAPTWSQAQDYIREVLNLDIEVFKSALTFYDRDENKLPAKYQFLIEKTGYTDDYLYNSVDFNRFFDNYRDAREQALLKALELIKNN